MDLENKTIKELRRLCFSKAISDGRTGRDRINSWRKDNCVSYLTTGAWDLQPTTLHSEPSAPVSQAEPTATASIPIVVKSKPTATAAPSQDLADVLASALQGKLQAGLDEARVKELIDEAINSRMSRSIEVKLFDKTSVKFDHVHEIFEDVLTVLSLGTNVMLVGPAGSGKTTLAKQCAEALGLPFYYQAVSSQTTKADLLGYCDANGRYVPTRLRQAYEHGGLFLLDEVDAGNSNVLTSLNAMIDNKLGSFPDAIVGMHPDFSCIAAANTYGKGRSRDYVGRNELDGATLNRFAFIDMGYDEKLERSIAGDDAWVTMVQAIRKAVNDLGERLIVSPRASINGAKLIGTGRFSHNQVFDMVIFQGVASDVKDRVMQKAGL